MIDGRKAYGSLSSTVESNWEVYGEVGNSTKNGSSEKEGLKFGGNVKSSVSTVLHDFEILGGAGASWSWKMKTMGGGDPKSAFMGREPENIFIKKVRKI